MPSDPGTSSFFYPPNPFVAVTTSQKKDGKVFSDSGDRKVYNIVPSLTLGQSFLQGVPGKGGASKRLVDGAKGYVFFDRICGAPGFGFLSVLSPPIHPQTLHPTMPSDALI
ncbi:hypothetical protein ZHAS_00008105 [Anopheles sinensis]|uniref:Uncharacterized protein n=1 Tax=Anopheles sinensis TaxID=74873 RepID=A0A084VRJ7_ANOSI|nr:hypothetical protein ZHAS_00008105 [Anopheles sinensis]